MIRIGILRLRYKRSVRSSYLLPLTSYLKRFKVVIVKGLTSYHSEQSS